VVHRNNPYIPGHRRSVISPISLPKLIPEITAMALEIHTRVGLAFIAAVSALTLLVSVV
jgi:hypothetical protein